MKIVSLSCLASLLLAGACASDGMSEDGPGGKADDLGAGDAIAADHLDTVYGLEVDLEQVVTYDGGKEKREHTGFSGILQVMQAIEDGDGVALEMQIIPCSVSLPRGDGHPQILGSEVFAETAPIAVEGRLEMREGAVRLTTDTAAVIMGFAPDDAIADALPADESDLVDQDGDGRPGVSIQISIRHLFAAIRGVFALSGDASNPQMIAGDANIHTDWRIYGDDIPLVNAARRAQELMATRTVVSEAHHFTMRSLDQTPALARCPE